MHLHNSAHQKIQVLSVFAPIATEMNSDHLRRLGS